MSKLVRQMPGGLAKYNPSVGLKRVAGAEAAEKHYARAKDATNLERAIREKLEAQAEFVFWWDSRDKNKGAQGDRRPNRERGNRSVIAPLDAELAEQLGTSLMRISRWRKKLNDPNAFEKTYEAVRAKYPKLLEFDTTAHVGGKYPLTVEVWHHPRLSVINCSLSLYYRFSGRGGG